MSFHDGELMLAWLTETAPHALSNSIRLLCGQHIAEKVSPSWTTFLAAIVMQSNGHDVFVLLAH